MKVKQNLRVRIDADAMQRIWHWTDLATGEFSCLGLVSDDLIVSGVQLFDQVCTAASTELDQEALANFLVAHPQPERVRAWIHSHGRLGVFWSQQDEQCIEGLANDSCLVSLVVNKKREFKLRVDLWKPFRVTFDDLPLEIRIPDQQLRAECEAAFTQHVVEMAPTPLMPVHRLSKQEPVQYPGYDDDFSDWNWR